MRIAHATQVVGTTGDQSTPIPDEQDDVNFSTQRQQISGPAGDASAQGFFRPVGLVNF
jgi:hypothetical protein